MAFKASYLYNLDLNLAQQDDSGRFYRRLTYLLLGIIALTAITGIVVPAGLGWDFANFYDTGRRAAAWQIADLYNAESLIAGAPAQGKMPYWGAPISAFIFAPLSFFSPEWALLVFKLQNVLMFFGAWWLLYWNNRRFAEASPLDQWKFAALFASLILLYQPFWAIFRIGGQSTPTVFLLFTIALLNYTKEKFRVAAVCVVLALLIKPGFVFVLLPLCLVSGWRFLRALAFTFITVGLVSILLLGWDIHAVFLQVMVQGLKNSYPWFYNSSLYVTAENLRMLAVPPVDIRLVAVPMMLLKLAILWLFGWLYWLSRREDWSGPARRHFEFLMAITFCLMLSQTVWEHYLAMLFLPLAYVVSTARQFSFRAKILLAMVFAVSLFQNIVLVNILNSRFSLNSVPELIVIGLLKSSPLWLTLIFFIRYRREYFQSYRMPEWERAMVLKS